MSEPQNKKPKLSNKPTPKEPPKKASFGRKLMTFAVLGVLVFALVTMKMFSDSTGRPPWQWSGEDWTNYLTFSRETAKQGAQQAHAKFNEIDWDQVKTKITEKTKALWNRLTKVEKEVEARLEKEKERREELAKKVDTSGSSPAKAPVKTTYEKALEAMRKAIRHYRNSPNSQAAIKDAKRYFEQARTLLEKALNEVPADQKPEVESLIQECNQYVYDCVKREKV